MNLQKLITKFIQQLISIVESDPNLAELKSNVAILENDVQWYPDYGCAMLASPSEFVGKCDLNIVLLDGWELRRSCSSGLVEQHAVSQCIQVLALGQVQLKDVNNIIAKVTFLKQKASALSDNKKSAVNGQGYQNTPSFIEALYRQAILTKDDKGNENDEWKKVTPYGGTTDCGRYTGGEPRVKPLPLVWAVFESLVGNNAQMINVKIAYFFSRMSDVTYVNSVMEDIREVVPLLDSLNKEGVDVTAKVQYVTSQRERLENELLSFNEAHAEIYNLVNSVPIFPMLWIPASQLKPDSAVGNIRALALEAIGRVPSRPEGLSLANTLSWCHRHPDKLFVAACIEEVFERYAMNLNDLDMSVVDLESMIGLKNYFKSIVTPTGFELKSEVKSRKLLMEFITVCAVHTQCQVMYPDVASKRLELSQDSLRFAVFRNKQQEDEALAVINYLTAVNTNKKQYLFSTTYKEGTIAFARKHARECPQMIQRLEEEKDAVETRRNVYWQKVLVKKEEVKELRETLLTLQREIETAEHRHRTAQAEANEARIRFTNAEQLWSATKRRLAVCKGTYNTASANKNKSVRPGTYEHGYKEYYNNVYDDAINELNDVQIEHDAQQAEKYSKQREPTTKESIYTAISNELDSLRNQVKRTQEKIAEVIKAPPFVINPLPYEDDNMQVVIFFQMIPRVLDLLCLCIFSSQSMLAETSPINITPTDKTDFDNVWRSTQCPFSYIEHYNIYGHPKATKEMNLLIYSEGNEIPKHYGISNIDNIIRAADSPMWFPLPNFSFMSATRHNPFLCTHSLTKRLYSEPVHLDIQFIVDYPEEKSESARGNIVYSKLNALPSSFSPTKFINLCCIRAFPNTQMQRLIDALQEDWLPLGEDIVRIVLSVALGQLGDVTNGQVDFRHVVDCWIQLESRLQKQAERLRNTPRNHSEILALGAVAKFLSSHTENNNISSLFSSMAIEWAEMVEVEYLETLGSGNYDKLQSLRAKQALMYGYAIICQGDLYQESDATDLAKWIVKFNNCLVFSENEIHAISHIIESVRVEMAQKVHILDYCFANDSVLTGALQSVVQCPDDLHWEKLDYCYESTKDGNHYMINLLTGCILVNASAPGVLPQYVMNDPLYKRHFGDRNFEVIYLSKNTMQTRLPIDGEFMYEFTGTLKVMIREISNDDVLELVNLDLSHLPKRLSALYSHWYSEQHQAVYFRGIKYTERNIDFEMKLHEGTVKCFQKPLNQDFVYSSVLVFLSPNSISKILSKFERKEYIHVLQYVFDKQTRWELKRFGLSFSSLVNGVIASEENAGYSLSQCQQLKDFSVAFTGYLVLEKGQDVRLLIPKGKVVRKDKDVSIEISEAPHDTLGYYIYDKHLITGEYKCSSIEARLHLAVICAAVSTLLPIPLLKATGSEFSLKLLQQSWVNRPYTTVELSKLDNLQEFYCQEPGLVVQELDNRRKAVELNCLYGITEEDVEYNRERWTAAKYELDRIEKSSECSNKCRRGCSNKYIRFQWKNTVAELSDVPFKVKYVKDIEVALQKRLILKPRQLLPFPFINSDVKDIVKKELKESWENYIKDPCFLALQKVPVSSIDIKGKLSIVLYYITSALSTTASSEFSNSLELNKAANFIPQFTFEDILHIALDKMHIAHFNPYLSEKAITQLHEAVITYLTLIVLQDKLQRITSGGAGDVVAQLLNCVRDWDPFKHPHWLVFEVENGIQIRPEQYQMVKHLLENPASISQLTMGSGKTRVLMPMLILEYLATKKGIPRVNVLSNISTECIDFLHEHLTASVFNLHMILQPFHRQVVLDENGIETLHSIESRNHPSFKVVCPEHRLSLQLKYLEMVHGNQPTAQSLKELLHKKHYIDIFDESDALLSHKYQLIYAVGDVQPLANWEERSIVVQSLLRVLNNDEEVAMVLSISGFSVAEGVPVGMFRKIVLSPESCDPNIVNYRTLLREALFYALLRSPPPDLRWFIAEHKDAVLEISKKAPSLTNEKHQAQLLSLRGLLGFGVLESCLERRSRVHYGLDGRRMKRTAVPFRAADVPSDRSEFSHPDTCLLYTTLSYYYEGLNEQQVKEALQKLLELGPEARKTYYNRAIQSMDLTPEERCQIDEVGKVDLSNLGQMSLLYNKLSFNVEMINFWLNAVVVRKDTGQYPQRIVSNSWDLAASSHIVGFSGTKDNHRLLPLQVKQHEPAIPKLLGADANMMHILIQQSVRTIEFGAEAFLDTAGSFDALIDTGSLLAGQKLDELASKLLTKCEHQGVMYYKDGWQVLERRSGMVIPRQSSALMDSECYIVFDEARTRGSDTRMGKQAKALLTLGQGLARDKLVQGAGRLRQLGKGQTLVMAGTADVLREMTEPKQVLEWVLRNTAIDTEQGLAEWASQGIQFHSRIPFIDEDWTLTRLYSDAEVEESLPVVVRRKVSLHTECILLHCEKYGQDVMVSRNGSNEECERELQLEEEREQEMERQIDPLHAAVEKAWNYGTVRNANNVREITATNCKLLGTALPANLGWEKFAVYATENFLTTCTHRVGRTIHEAMRRAWGMLIIDNEVLLLSDMESNGLCKDANFFRTVVIKYSIIELYNGETSYEDLEQLKRYTVGSAKKVLKEIVDARGLWMNWSCSALKAACED